MAQTTSRSSWSNRGSWPKTVCGVIERAHDTLEQIVEIARVFRILSFRDHDEREWMGDGQRD